MLKQHCLLQQHRVNNPDRFLNRGCNLLKEEKAKKKLAIELPKVKDLAVEECFPFIYLTFPLVDNNFGQFYVFLIITV